MDWASFTIGAWTACMLAFAAGAAALYQQGAARLPA